MDIDRRHDRRALTAEEFEKLTQSAENGPVVETLPGPDRAMMYILAAWTGYRRKELSSLTLRSFDLDGPTPRVRVQAAYTNNKKRTDDTPLHPAVAERVRAWLAAKEDVAPDVPLFPLRTYAWWWRKTSKMMRLDLERAGLPYIDEDGLYADFHANRHTFISNLGKAGVSLTVAQKLARHSTAELTSNVYTHLGLSDRASAIESLPAPPSSDGPRLETPAMLKATGTDGRVDKCTKRLPHGCHRTGTNTQNAAQRGTEQPERGVTSESPQHVSLKGFSTDRHGEAEWRRAGSNRQPPACKAWVQTRFSPQDRNGSRSSTMASSQDVTRKKSLT